MFESDVVRQVLLYATALTFFALAVRTVISPDAVAAELGYSLSKPNGYSELHAIYFGLWLVSAGLCVFAALRISTAVLGDIVAALVLAQPLGRFVALPRFGLPRGSLLAFFVLEVVGGVLLLLVRPAAA